MLFHLSVRPFWGLFRKVTFIRVENAI
jgi:hypothetical protein